MIEQGPSMPAPSRASGRLASIRGQARSGLGRLPSEVRTLIWQYFFLNLAVRFKDGREPCVDQIDGLLPDYTFANVSRTCALFHAEVRHAFFSHATFIFSHCNDFRMLKLRGTKDALRLIRYVEVDLIRAVNFGTRRKHVHFLKSFENLREVAVQLPGWMLFYSAGTCWEDALTANLLWINCVETPNTRFLQSKARRNVMDLPLDEKGECGWLMAMVSEAAAGRQAKPFRLVLNGTVAFRSSTGPPHIYGSARTKVQERIVEVKVENEFQRQARLVSNLRWTDADHRRDPDEITNELWNMGFPIEDITMLLEGFGLIQAPEYTPKQAKSRGMTVQRIRKLIRRFYADRATDLSLPQCRQEVALVNKYWWSGVHSGLGRGVVYERL